MEEHWSDADFVVFKVDLTNAFKVVSRQVVGEKCDTFSLNCCHGCLGTMGHTLCCGTWTALSFFNQVNQDV